VTGERKTLHLHLSLPDDAHAAVIRLAAIEDRSVTSMLTRLALEALRTRGLIPEAGHAFD